MDEPGFFAQTRILFIGLGLMGGSLALALKDKVAWLGGADISAAALQQAAQLQLFDALSPDYSELLSQANVIILGAPVRQNGLLIEELSRLQNNTHIVLDLSSTKRQIVQALAALPASYDPIGAHPMCGSEKSSIQYARPDLFQGANFILSPLPRSSPKAKAFLLELIRQIKANPLEMDPAVHDRMTAATSHFPYLVSACLSLATSPENKPLVSTGFKSTARLAGSSTSMMLDILMSNPDNVLASMVKFKVCLEEFETALQNRDAGKLANLIELANSKYYSLIE